MKGFQDRITMTRIGLLHPNLRDEAFSIYRKAEDRLTEWHLRFSYTLRTFQEQELLYSQGRTRPGKIVTNSRAGQSYHNYGLSVDICLVSPDGKHASWNTKEDYDKDGVPDWMEVVEVFKKYNWNWGGNWINSKDYPHFEKTFGYNWRQLLDKFNKKEFIPNTKYVIL